MKIYLTICTLLCAFFLQAQEIQLLNKTTLKPIEGAVVALESNKNELWKSDQLGKVPLPKVDNPSTVLYVKHPNYGTNTFTFGQIQKESFKLYLTEVVNDLEEVIVSANKFEEKKDDVAQKVQVISQNELENMNQTSMADVMQQSGNVMVQKSQLGGGSPIIRGFETNRVLMVVDGVRLNNAIYRGGHLQNIITMDNATMERVEIVFGPGSVMYGSDALGGVMHFYTKNPTMSSDDKTLVTGSAFGRFSSANMGSATHADISVANKKFGSLTSFTYSNYGDLRQGSVRNPYYGSFGARTFYVDRVDGKDSAFINKDTNLQVLSGYQQYDFLQKFQFIQSEKIKHVLNFQYSTSSDIPRYDRLTQTKNGAPRYAQWYYGPQERLFASYKLELTKGKKFYDNARLVAGFQMIEESRNNRNYQSDDLAHRIENLNIFSLNADFTKEVGKHEIRYGAEAYYNDVMSTAFNENIVTGEETSLDTRYPDGGSSMQSVALYLTDNWELNDKYILNTGVRGSYVGLDATFNDKTFFPFDYNIVNQANTALNGSVGLVAKPFKTWRFALLGSSGFRAPNVDDLSKVFESQPGNVLVPNPNLKPEYSYNAELTVSKTFFGKVTTQVTAYSTWLQNALTVQKATFNGQDSILYDGSLSQVTTTTNAAQAYIYGIEGAVSGNITESLSVYGSINYTYGRIVTDTTDYPLDHIPPVFGKAGFSLKLSKFRSDFYSQFSGWKRLEDYNLIGEDNFANATPFGMPAWYTLNARFTYQFNKYIGLQVACENILDVNYRVFASNISAPGRNVIATLRVSF